MHVLQNEEERNRAEVARLSLRHGFCAMLEAAQKRRTLEPALQAAFVSELSQLQKVAFKWLTTLLLYSQQLQVQSCAFITAAASSIVPQCLCNDLSLRQQETQPD